MKISRNDFFTLISSHKVAVLHCTSGRTETRMQIDEHTFDKEISILKDSDFDVCRTNGEGFHHFALGYHYFYFPHSYDTNFYRYGNVLVAENMHIAHHKEYHYDVFFIKTK